MFYEQIKEIQSLAWRDDDRMDQETLFELQDKIAELALQIASREKKVDDLVKSFPFLYKVGGEE